MNQIKKFKQTTISLPEELYEDLQSESDRLGISVYELMLFDLSDANEERIDFKNFMEGQRRKEKP